MFFYCKLLSIFFTSLMHITFTVRCLMWCDLVWQSRVGNYTRRQWHAPVFWSTNQWQSFLRSTEKRKISLHRTQRSMFYKSTEHSPRFHSEFEYKCTCTIQHLKRNFSRLCKLRKRSTEVCDPSHALMSFRCVIRRALAIARLSLTSLKKYLRTGVTI